MNTGDHENMRTGATPLVRQKLRLNPSLTKQLTQLSRDENTSLRIIMLAAFQAMLYRYTDSTDIVLSLGGQTESTSVDKLEEAALLHVDLAGDPSLCELLNRSQTIDQRATQHANESPDNLIVALRTDRGVTDGASLNARYEFIAAAQGPRQSSDDGFGTSELRLRVVTKPKAIECLFECEGEIFDADAVSRMGGHLQTVLEGMPGHRRRPLSRLPLLTKSERRQLLVDWNTESEESGEGLFRHQFFEDQVDSTPDALAVVSAGCDPNDGDETDLDETASEQNCRTLTYRQLDERANQVANYLIERGVDPEVRVGVSMEASPELVIAVMGICKAGGACVPLDPSFPGDQLAYMIDDADVAVILTQKAFIERLPRTSRPVVCLDVDWNPVLSNQSKQRPPNRLLNDNLAIVFYTSGSTGKPKAVMSTHRRLARQDSPGFGAEDRHLLKTSIGFTPLQAEIFLPLTTGGQIVAAPPEIRMDSRRLIEFMAEHEITVTNFVPSMLRQILGTPGLERCQSLRHVFCFGEPLPVDLRERFFAQLDAILDVHYGTTEATSASRLTMTRADFRRTDTVGRRNKLRKLYILDAHLQPVPCGITGELYVGGALARGYLNRPDLTAERFVPDPFSRSGGERLYRTGDRARFLADGSIQFLGRLDDQVKIRGYRVELGEVAAVLRQCPGIDSAVVVVRQDKIRGNQLVAYMAAGRNPAPEQHQVRQFLQSKLPSYMIPAWLVILDSLPLGRNGKVDRHALPEPELSMGVMADFVAPRTELEKELAKIWCDVLGIPRVGVHDDFLELGGHSLAAMRLTSRIEDVLGIQLPLRTFFESPTIADVADRLCAALIEDPSKR